MKLFTAIIGLIFFVSIANASENGTQSFSDWLQEVRQEAQLRGLNEATLDRVFPVIEYMPQVIVLDRKQPEFVSTFTQYLNRRVREANISQGRQLLRKHSILLEDIERKTGVPGSILVAFWGLETHFGKVQGHYPLASALATLAYEGRRSAFFRDEFFNLLEIKSMRKLDSPILHGSWAGATGQVQFMPSTYLHYAVDADQDGDKDIWSSVADALGSAANYLSAMGWHAGEPVAIQTVLPDHFDYRLAQMGVRKSLHEWGELGVRMPDNIDTDLHAAILIPQGWQGPAFFVFDNFDVVMRWNRSVAYALSVASMADWLVRDTPFQKTAGIDDEALSYNEIWAIQSKLNALGYECGNPDGFPGLKTQAAIRHYQADRGLIPDGYASRSLYQTLISQ